MFRPRVIPCLLLKDKGLVKTTQFQNPVYLGDPINTIRIFNEKGVDELIFLDIFATAEKLNPSLYTLERIATECFMPVCYGGGIKNMEIIRKILNIGIEKVSIGSFAVENPNFIKEASEEFGSQSIIVCIDVKKNFLNTHEVVTHNAKKKTGIDPSVFALKMQDLGAGEILINSVDREGTRMGYDIELIKKITQNLSIPVVACGGAGKLEDVRDVVVRGGASAAAVGSLFVLYGKYKAVLINYPEEEELQLLFNSKNA